KSVNAALASSRLRRSDASDHVAVVRQVPLDRREYACACGTRVRAYAESDAADTSSSRSATFLISEKKPCGARKRTQPQRLRRLYVLILRHVNGQPLPLHQDRARTSKLAREHGHGENVI